MQYYLLICFLPAVILLISGALTNSKIRNCYLYRHRNRMRQMDLSNQYLITDTDGLINMINGTRTWSIKCPETGNRINLTTLWKDWDFNQKLGDPELIKLLKRSEKLRMACYIYLPVSPVIATIFWIIDYAKSI